MCLAALLPASVQHCLDSIFVLVLPAALLPASVVQHWLDSTLVLLARTCEAPHQRPKMLNSALVLLARDCEALHQRHSPMAQWPLRLCLAALLPASVQHCLGSTLVLVLPAALLPASVVQHWLDSTLVLLARTCEAPHQRPKRLNSALVLLAGDCEALHQRHCPMAQGPLRLCLAALLPASVQHCLDSTLVLVLPAALLPASAAQLDSALVLLARDCEALRHRLCLKACPTAQVPLRLLLH